MLVLGPTQRQLEIEAGLTKWCVATDAENLKAANKESFPFFNQVCGPVPACCTPCIIA